MYKEQLLYNQLPSNNAYQLCDHKKIVCVAKADHKIVHPSKSVVTLYYIYWNKA
jgi:hypothetical protein